MKIFGREPALVLAALAAVIQLLSAFLFHLTSGQQGVLNALAVAIVGLVTSWAVRGDQGVPLVMGLLKALLALGLAFGLKWAPDLQSTVMVAATALVAMFVRTQVVAPVAPKAFKV